jgi:hypothetical protein
MTSIREFVNYLFGPFTRNKWLLFLNIFIVIIPMILGYLLVIVPKRKIDEEKLKKYQSIKYKDKLCGSIINIRDIRGHSYVTFTDSSKKCLIHSRNYNYPEPWLNGFLQIGDSLVKKSDNDTLNIYRQGTQYYFVLGKDIGE